MRQRAQRAAISLRLGVARTRGAAWALGPIMAIRSGALGPLLWQLAPPAWNDRRAAAVFGLRHINDLSTRPRGPLARRFGSEVIDALDQALGPHPKAHMPSRGSHPHYRPFALLTISGTYRPCWLM